MTTKQQRRDRAWSRYINAECRDLARAGLARVSKNHEAPRIPGKQIPRAKSKPDYSGFLTDGRHVVFEAKTSEVTTRFDFSLLRDHQWEHLDEAHRCGCVSFVYFLDGDRNKWVIPWDRVLSWKRIRSSVPLGECEILRKREGETWLDTFDRIRVTTVADELAESAAGDFDA